MPAIEKALWVRGKQGCRPGRKHSIEKEVALFDNGRNGWGWFWPVMFANQLGDVPAGEDGGLACGTLRPAGNAQASIGGDKAGAGGGDPAGAVQKPARPK